jgi:methylenetetrahydrofolate dehydrogenase (NADP+)/methenyltetrahydrofolate cyclohydrolase
MTAKLLDGKALAATMQAEIAAGAAAFLAHHGRKPGLAAVLVSDDPTSPSHTYVRNKRRACEKSGLTSWLHELPAATSQAELLRLVARLNADPAVHGILVQLPLPPQIDEAAIIDAVAPLKDVDGFGPLSLGLLADERARFVACTPLGVQQLLIRNGVTIRGAHVVVIGRSSIVGKPLALLLARKGDGGDATVTLCHSRTRDLPAVTRQADILVAAMGKPRFVNADMVKPGAVVVDVGTNRLPDGSWCGDVDFDAVREVASALSPVPGGVGPMTITMLLHNTLQAARLQTGV